jgi:hypothetical protein
MKHALIAIGLISGFGLFSATEASAVVCGRGVVRAGCVSASGAAVVRRPVVAPRAVVVAPRRRVVR